MSTDELLERINLLLQGIAKSVVEFVSRETKKKWDNLIVSVRWVGDSGIYDLIIESSRSTGVKYHVAPMALLDRLTELGQLKQQLEKPWLELLLRINSTGECNTQFGYE